MNWTFSYRDSGLTPYHRAGMAGLALSLRMLQERGELPAGMDVVFPDRQQLYIRGVPFDKSGLLKLIHLAYRIDDKSNKGLIDFPVLSGWTEQNRAKLQSLLLRTWFQHPQSRSAAKQQVTLTSMMDGDQQIEWSYLPIERLKALESAVDKWDTVRKKGGQVEISSLIVPGAMIRHNAVKSTALTDSIQHYPLLLFALLGCLHYDGRAYMKTGDFDNRTESFVVIPRAESLQEYVDKLSGFYKWYAQDHIHRSWLVTGTSDAALTSAVMCNIETSGLHRKLTTQLSVIRFGKVVWSQQKTRTAVLHTSKMDPLAVKRYKIAKESLELSNSEGVYPLRESLSYNLIHGFPWYRGFAEFCGAKGWPLITRWKAGLKAMSSKSVMWNEDEQRQFVLYMQNAIRNRFGKVGNDAQQRGGDGKTMISREYDRMRIAWSKARTKQEFQFGLMDFLADTHPKHDGLEQHPREILLTLIKKADWRDIRDLCLLALATYTASDKSEE